MFKRPLVESATHPHLDVDVPAPLDPAVLAKAEDLPLPLKQEEPSEPSSTDKKPKVSLSSGKDKKAVPRWLKLGSSACRSAHFPSTALLTSDVKTGSASCICELQGQSPVPMYLQTNIPYMSARVA